MVRNKKNRFFLKFLILGFVLLVSLSIILIFLKTKQETPKSINIYFLKAGKISYVVRKVPEKADVLYFAVGELLKGPTDAEKKLGYFSEIPKETKFRTIYKKRDTVVVDFTKELGDYGGGTTKVQNLLSQIVYTLIDVSKAKKVQILIDGQYDVVLGSEGYVLDKPLTIEDVKNF